MRSPADYIHDCVVHESSAYSVQMDELSADRFRNSEISGQSSGLVLSTAVEKNKRTALDPTESMRKQHVFFAVPQPRSDPCKKIFARVRAGILGADIWSLVPDLRTETWNQASNSFRFFEVV